MGAAPQVYSPLVWYVVDGARVAYKVVNRADNPEPGGAPIDFPSYQFIEYAAAVVAFRGGRLDSGRDEAIREALCHGRRRTSANAATEVAPRGLGLLGGLGTPRTGT